MAKTGDLPLEMRQKVLDTAARLFRDKGYAATTMREVADRAVGADRRHELARAVEHGSVLHRRAGADHDAAAGLRQSHLRRADPLVAPASR